MMVIKKFNNHYSKLAREYASKHPHDAPDENSSIGRVVAAGVIGILALGGAIFGGVKQMQNERIKQQEQVVQTYKTDLQEGRVLTGAFNVISKDTTQQIYHRSTLASQKRFMDTADVTMTDLAHVTTSGDTAFLTLISGGKKISQRFADAAKYTEGSSINLSGEKTYIKAASKEDIKKLEESGYKLPTQNGQSKTFAFELTVPK